MAFTFTWNTTFESQPADGEAESLGAQRIRDLKKATHERLVVDHSWAGDANDGKHVKVAGAPSQSPTLTAGDGCLYFRTVAGATELFYKTGLTDLQLTSAGKVVSAFPATTRMVFVQSSPPVGWSLDTSFVDRVLKIFGASGGASVGGSWIISGAVVGDTALSIAQLPPHTHDLLARGNQGGSGQGIVELVPGDHNTVSGSTGSGATHTHSWANDGTWRPAFAGAIVCAKQ